MSWLEEQGQVLILHYPHFWGGGGGGGGGGGRSSTVHNALWHGLTALYLCIIIVYCIKTIMYTQYAGRKNPKKKKSDPSSHWTEETEVTLTNVTEKNEVEDTDNSKPKNGQIENKVTEDEPEVKESKVDDKMEVTVATFGFPEVVIQSPPLSDTVFNGEKEVKKTTDKKPEETEIKKETSSVSGENKSDLEPKEADNESSTLKVCDTVGYCAWNMLVYWACSHNNI